MFRVNISLTHVLSVLVLVGTTHLLVRDNCVSDQNLENKLRTQAEVSLRRAAVTAEQAKQIDQAALAEDLKIYRYMTLQARPDLYKFLKKEKYSDISDSNIKKKLGEARKQQDDFELSAEDIRHLAVYERLLVGKYRFDNWRKSTQGKRNVDRGLLSRQPIQPDLVMALDSNGIGVAALGQDRYSWFGRDVAETHSGVISTIEDANSDPQLNVPRTEVWEWSWGEGDDRSLYQVAIAPIRPSKQDDPAGAIVVGYSIDDGTAEKNQRLFSGVTTAKNNTNADAQSGATPQVAFFRGSNLHASTVSTERESALEGAFFDGLNILKDDKPEQLVEFQVQDQSYIAFVRFFPGQFDVDKPAGFVIFTDVDDVTAPAETIMSTMYWSGGIVLVMGLLVLLLLYYRFMKPLASIEETISEILDGNKDATFVLAGDHPIFSELAEKLNRMSAYLQGKPMPDDEMDEDWGWGDDLDGDHEAETDPEATESPDVHGVGLDMARGDDTADDEEISGEDDTDRNDQR